MIKSFKHKGLQKFFETGSTAGINAQQANKIRLRLAALDAAETIEDMNRVGYNLHQLKGNKSGTWSITVTGNWRITFQFENGHAYITNYEDYH
ncbi:type II toxin-antitoxin system RelE/ParE family toxin [Providencia hangzhouensis]